MNIKHVFSNSVMLMAAEVIERILRLVLVIFSASILGDIEYGKFTFGLAFTSLFLILADGGIHQLLVREIAKDKQKNQKLAATALSLKLILSVGTLLLIGTTILILNKPQDVYYVVLILAVQMIIASFSDFFSSILHGHQFMKLDVWASLIFGLTVTGLGIVILKLGYDIFFLALVYLSGNLLRLGYLGFAVHRQFFKIKIGFDSGTARFLLKEGFPFGVLYFFALMYTYIDSTMLSVMIGDREVAWYNVAYRLIFAMLFIPVASMKAIFPAMSASYKNSIDEFSSIFLKSFKFMFAIGALLAINIHLYAEQIIILLFGVQYLPAAGVLKILVWSALFIYIGTVQTHATRATNHQGFTAKIVASGAVLNLVLNFILIPRYSINGAALATLCTEFFVFIAHGIFLAQKLVASPFLRLLPKIGLMIVCSIIFSKFIPIFFVVANLALATMSGFFILVLIQYFSKEEFWFFKNLVKSKS